MQYDQKIVMHTIWSLSAFEHSQFLIDQCARKADFVTDSLPLQFKPVDYRLRHMAGVVGQLRRSTATTRFPIGGITLGVLVDDLADMRD
jgi:hypothetical protein